MSNHPLDEKHFPDSQPKYALLELHAFPSGYVISHQREISSCLSTLPHEVAICFNEVSLQSSLWAEQTKWLSYSSYFFPSRAFTIFAILLWTFSNSFIPSLYCDTQNCTQYSRWGCTKAVYSGTITSLNQLAMLCLMHSSVQLVMLDILLAHAQLTIDVIRSTGYSASWFVIYVYIQAFIF